MNKVLFIGELRFGVQNGYFSRQEQIIRQSLQIGEVDIINLGDDVPSTRNWLASKGFKARVVSGHKISFLRYLFRFWYICNTFFCNKLKIYKYWKFFPKISISIFSGASYNTCIYYYLWPTQMIDIKNKIGKNIVDTGDVMGDRHSRIGVRRWITIDPLTEEKIIKSKKFTCIAISPNDSNEFFQLYGKKSPVLPYCGSFPISKDPTSPVLNLGYLGAKNNFSEDLVELLLSTSIIDKLAKKKIGIILGGTFCNHISESKKNDLISNGVKILGKVSNVSEFYDQVSMVLNLTGPSTGAKIKSVESLCYGKFLIATEYGVDRFTQKHFDESIFSVNWPLDENQLTQIILKASSNKKKDNSKDNALAYLRAVDLCFESIFCKE